MNHLDLFSGIGGFALAARWAGIDTIQFCEVDSFCKKVLLKNFPDIPIHDDIKTFNFTKKIDILTAGFPCQPFSTAGKKKGVRDDRYLWPDLIRIIRECKPKWIIAENVPGIIPSLDTILKDMENENYAWQAYLIPASSVNAPHKRERLWIIANHNSERCDDRRNNWQKRQIQDYIDRNIKKIQSEWSQLIPESWQAFNAQEFLTNPNLITDNKANCAAITSSKKGKAWFNNSGRNRKNSTIFNWQENQPPIPGVDDGLPDIVDRNKSLGNAVVPQIPFIFMSLIKQLEGH